MTKIQFHHKNLELDQYQPIDKLASFYFNEIELDHEYELDLQFCDSVQNFESMLTLISLPDLDPIFEPTLIPLPMHLEHEPPILNSHIPLLEKNVNINFLFGLNSNRN